MDANLNIKLDLGDEFVECDGGTENCMSISISEAIKDSIKYTLKNEILTKISKEMIESIRKDIYEYVTSNIKTFVIGAMDSELKTLKIKSGSYTSDPLVSANDFIKTMLEREIKNSDSARMVKAIASDYVTTLKERFDVVFVTTLMDKMLKVGLLKDDRVASLLIEPTETKS